MIHDEIDIIKLYSGTISGFEDNIAWNAWLTRCLNNLDLQVLVQVRRGLQMGMKTADKKKLTNESIVNTWCRWIGSIDKTIRKVVKAQDRLQNDGVHTASKSGLKDKRTRDSELELFLRKESY